MSACPDLFDKSQAAMAFQEIVKRLDPSSGSAALLAAAVDAAVTVYAHAAPKKPLMPIMSDAIGHILGLLQLPVLDAETQQVHVSDILSSLIALADYAPKLFKASIDKIFETIAGHCGARTLPDEVLHAYIELGVTLCDKAPSLVKHSGKLPMYLSALVSLLTVLEEDDDEWAQVLENAPLDDDDQHYAIAEQALDRVACALGASVTAPTLMALIPPMVRSREWTERHAAMMALASVAEGCHDALETHLNPLLVELVLPLLSDAHPRVRYAAVHCVGQLCTDFCFVLQRDHHAAFFSAVLPLVRDLSHPRVACHALSAIINFCEDAEPVFLAPHIEATLPLLFPCISSPRADVQEQAVTALAAMANVAGTTLMAPYYAALMAPLLSLLKSADRKLFRGKLIEAVSMLASAAPKDALLRDLPALYDTLDGLVMEEDDCGHEYLMAAWVRICSATGAEAFAPMLPRVLPALLEKARVEPQVAYIEDEDDEAYADWDIVHIRGKRVGINTALLEEKADAIETLDRYIELMGAHILPHTSELVPLILPLVSYDLHERVRGASAACLATLLTTLKSSKHDPLPFWHEHAHPTLLAAIKKYADPEILTALYGALAACLDALKDMSGALNEPFVAALVTALTASMKRIALDDLHKRVEPEEGDEVDPGAEDVQYLLSEVNRVIHFLIVNRNAHTHACDTIISVANTLFGSIAASPAAFADGPVHDALCFYDDLIEFKAAPPQSLPFNFFASALSFADEDAVQAAAYGIGLLALNYPSDTRAFCQQAATHLANLLAAHKGKHRYASAMENALSAIVKIASTGALDVQLVVAALSSGLPIVNDQEEMPVVYGFLARLIPTLSPAHCLALLKPTLMSLVVLSIQQKNDILTGLVPVVRANLLPSVPADQLRNAIEGLDQSERTALSALNILN